MQKESAARLALLATEVCEKEALKAKQDQIRAEEKKLLEIRAADAAKKEEETKAKQAELDKKDREEEAKLRKSENEALISGIG